MWAALRKGCSVVTASSLPTLPARVTCASASWIDWGEHCQRKRSCLRSRQYVRRMSATAHGVEDGGAAVTQGQDATGPLALATVVSIEQSTPSVKTFWLETVLAPNEHDSTPNVGVAAGDPKPPLPTFSFLAGQWVDMFIPGVDTVGGFSIANAPSVIDAPKRNSGKPNTRMVQLAVKEARHPPAKWMHTECAVGTTVEIRAGGSVVLRDAEPDRPALFIAGGIGIVPLHSMILERAEISKELTTPCVSRLLYSVRHTGDLLFGESLGAVKGRCQGLDGTVFLTGPDRAPLDTLHGFDVAFGRINAAIVAAELAALGEPDVYICGQQDMCDELERMLRDLGCPQHRIIYEKWW